MATNAKRQAQVTKNMPQKDEKSFIQSKERQKKCHCK